MRIVVMTVCAGTYKSAMEQHASEEDDPAEEPVEPVTRCQADAILEFYREHGEAPTRGGRGKTTTAKSDQEPVLATSLYKLRRMAAANKHTPSTRLLLEEAPELLRPVITMEDKAAQCVTILKPNPPASRVPKWCIRFIENRRSEVKNKKRSLDDEVCQILTRGLPNWNESKRLKRGGLMAVWTLLAPENAHALKVGVLML